LKKTLPSRHAQHADSAQNQANRMLRMAAQKVLHSLRDFQDDVLVITETEHGVALKVVVKQLVAAFVAANPQSMVAAGGFRTSRQKPPIFLRPSESDLYS